MNINHAILHVFDFTACINTYAVEELDLNSKNAKSYVQRMAKKTLSNLDNKHGNFAEDSMFACELDAYFRGERNFADLSCQIAEFIAGELGKMEKSESTDLLVIDFEDDISDNIADMSESEAQDAFAGRGKRYFALLLLESKPAFVHELNYGEIGERNDIVRSRSIMPNPSQKIPSYAVIDLRTLAVQFVDKKRSIAGEETYLIPERLLQCSIEASSKEAFAAVTEIVEAVAEEYGANTAQAVSRAKNYAAENAQESDDLDLEEMARDIFEESPEMQQRFESAVESMEIPKQMPLEREAVRRVSKTHKIRTDTGIEITFPAEYSRNPEYLTFTSESDGSISIQLKNIGHIENR